jgi:TolB-like protein/DNA-binding winged helix-turn-helix (wHTH) protein/Tfp pilus assembly protein PilF
VVISLVDRPSGYVDFGRFRLLPDCRELRADGVAIELGSRAFDILTILIEARGALVTKDELLSRVWPHTVVEENNLVVQVSALRRALGKDRDLIRTVSGRGYLFVGVIQTSVSAADGETLIDDGAAVAVQSAESSNPPPPVPVSGLIARETSLGGLSEIPSEVVDITGAGRSSRSSAWRLFAFRLARLLAAPFNRARYSQHKVSSQIRSIAVLPLESLSGDPSQDYFADGMTDELIAALGQISALRVISRTSIMTYKGVRRLLPEIARELNVEALVEGTVFRSGERVRVTAQLIELPIERHIWAGSFEGDLRDTLALQNSVALTIAGQIRATMTQQEQAALQASNPVNPVAYEAYLKGQYFLNKRTGDGLRAAIEYYTIATDEDPNYAKAYTSLADAYALSGDWQYGSLSPQDAFSKAKAAATRALSLNNNLAEAHTSLAFILDLYAWDWAGAQKEFERAIALYPGYATARHWYAWHLAVMGRIGDGIAELRQAESLDPLSLIIGADLADALCIAHLYDDSILQSQKILELEANFGIAHYQLGQALVQKSLSDRAIPEFERAIELSGSNPIFVANLAHAYAVAGRSEDARKIISDLEERQRQSASVEAGIALIYVGLGDKEQAMAWLNKAYQARFNPSVLLRPGFDPLRSDDRFQDLVRRIGLPALAPQVGNPPI